mmetsp:Transcript_25823/g.41984  ORF Transcript_25823/g.41984 Transcript_25823/m.41984 type:complete len:231 (-) Transcript_25823:45-737(-)
MTLLSNRLESRCNVDAVNCTRLFLDGVDGESSFVLPPLARRELPPPPPPLPPIIIFFGSLLNVSESRNLSPSILFPPLEEEEAKSTSLISELTLDDFCMPSPPLAVLLPSDDSSIDDRRFSRCFDFFFFTFLVPSAAVVVAVTSTSEAPLSNSPPPSANEEERCFFFFFLILIAAAASSDRSMPLSSRPFDFRREDEDRFLEESLDMGEESSVSILLLVSWTFIFFWEDR